MSKEERAKIIHDIKNNLCGAFAALEDDADEEIKVIASKGLREALEKLDELR